jgi:hypothetical protein
MECSMTQGREKVEQLQKQYKAREGVNFFSPKMAGVESNIKIEGEAACRS